MVFKQVHSVQISFFIVKNFDNKSRIVFETEQVKLFTVEEQLKVTSRV